MPFKPVFGVARVRAGETTNDWLTRGAALYLASPVWSAAMMQVPAEIRFTLPLVRVQTPEVKLLKLTFKPLLAVAAGELAAALPPMV